MKRLKGIALLLLLGGFTAVSGQQGGSLFLADVQPLLDQKRALFDQIAADFDIFEVGDASRISHADNPTLAGTRVGPYTFFAKLKESLGPYKYELRIETRTTFLDETGRKVSLKKAAEIKEEITAILLQPVPPEEYFTPTPD